VAALAKPGVGKARSRARDEEVVAVVVQVILREGTVSSQTRLAELVNGELARGRRVTPERVRVLAVRSGLVGVSIRARARGPAPGDLKACPVCRSRVRKTVSQTLTGGTASTGWRCTRCPWWTGRDLRVPSHYTFHAKVSRGEKGQLTFLGRGRAKDKRL
jgi:hypothetical protein